jgi:hypothetical protein
MKNLSYTLIIYLVLSSLSSCNKQEKSFQIVRSSKPAASIYLPDHASGALKYAVEDFNEDCMEVCGTTLPVISNLQDGIGHVIIPIVAEDLESYGIKELEAQLDLGALEGKWESTLIQQANLKPDQRDKILVIAGSDIRGVIYGLYEVSEKAFGTDPQKYWTDAIPTQRKNVAWNEPTRFQGPPTFKFRGFFINDENFLMSWKGNDDDIEKEVLAEIFEYILRLRGNFFVESEYALPFGDEIKKLATERGLYYSASHLQVLMTYPRFEWAPFCKENFNKDLDYLFYKSPEHENAIATYWEEAVKKQMPYKTIWPIGLRYLDDRDYVDVDPDAPESPEERAILTSGAVDRQNSLLEKFLDDDPITTYSMRGDLLTQYLTGDVKLPESTIVVWNDAGSFNIFPALPSQKDLSINPNHGVYYHLSYCDNQWVQYVPVKKIQNEFRKVIEVDATSLVMYNVGDIREIPLTIAAGMDIAFNAEPWMNDNTYHSEFSNHWCSKQYGEDAGDEIGKLLMNYWEMESECRANSVIETVTVPLLYIDPLSNIHDDLKEVITKPIFEFFKKNQNNPEAIAGYSAEFKLKEGGRYGQANLNHFQSTTDQWRELMKLALDLEKKVITERKPFYFDSVILHIISSYYSREFGRNFLLGMEASGRKEFDAASEYFIKASDCIIKIGDYRKKAEHDQWENWFSGANNPFWERSAWAIHVDRTVDACNAMAEVCKIIALENDN